MKELGIELSGLLKRNGIRSVDVARHFDMTQGSFASKIRNSDNLIVLFAILDYTGSKLKIQTKDGALLDWSYLYEGKIDSMKTQAGKQHATSIVKAREARKQ